MTNKNVLYDRCFFFLFPVNVFLIQYQDCLFRLRSEVKDSGPLRRCKLTTFLLSSRTTQKEKKKKTSESDYVRQVWHNVR